MPNIRLDVWDIHNGKAWADPILWYAKAVADMQSRELADRTSWRFYAAIHGFDDDLWERYGYLSSADVKPGSADQMQFWLQCQHGSWFFLPWHRGYLLAFEANVRATIEKLGGPKDWTLPYWNYFKSNQNLLPPEFASKTWPGPGVNPLFVEQRYGPNNDGKVSVPPNLVDLKAMTEPDFTGVASGGSRGFGGIDAFDHSGEMHGVVEMMPHDQVHGLVGGIDPTSVNLPPNKQLPGLMSDPDTAGLDPIFWLHHANIDRLWGIWRQNPVTHEDPTDATWLTPAFTGQQPFSMPMPDGSAWNYVPKDMEDLTILGYTYDDLSPATPPPPSDQRLLLLGASPATARSILGDGAMPTGKNVELIGANQGVLQIAGTDARTSIKFDANVRKKVSMTLSKVVDGFVPDRIFLNLENIRGVADSTILQIYVGLADGANPEEHPENHAGSVALFGVRKASLVDGRHAGRGLSLVVEITKIVDDLHLANSLAVADLAVRLIPVNPVPENAKISIGRISIFRQGV